ncbi:Hypothetical_protein [Hexamita inflata]|uniref:Hypothetical_protein n=1 Tax=Hexamita inflata TaxID=28002 RepID=A0AA86N4H1_9EUKA|nr:Hypothetical protein HINF_LOCUS216 [Hexamita inflata]
MSKSDNADTINAITIVAGVLTAIILLSVAICECMKKRTDEQDECLKLLPNEIKMQKAPQIIQELCPFVPVPVTFVYPEIDTVSKQCCSGQLFKQPDLNLLLFKTIYYK